MDAVLKVLERFVSLLEKHGIWYRVCGGLAVDGYAGKLTRAHHDVDIVMKDRDVYKLCELPIFVVKLRIPQRSVMRAKLPGSEVIIEILLLETDERQYWIKGRKDHSLVPLPLVEGEIVSLCGINFRAISKDLLLVTKLYTDRPIDIQDRELLTKSGANMETAQLYQFCYVVKGK